MRSRRVPERIRRDLPCTRNKNKESKTSTLQFFFLTGTMFCWTSRFIGTLFVFSKTTYSFGIKICLSVTRTKRDRSNVVSVRRWIVQGYPELSKYIVYNIQYTIYDVQCTMYNVQCTMYNVQCAMCNVQCAVYSVQCTMDNVQCTMYNVHYTV